MLGGENDAVDFLSRLNMDIIASDTVMTYVKNKANDNFCQLLVGMNMTSSPIEEISDEMTELDPAECIDARIDKHKFVLDVWVFEQSQQQDKVLHTIVTKELELYPNDTKNTTEEVENVYLLYEDKKIIVPATLQGRVREWYKKKPGHPYENPMKQSIHCIYNWKGSRNEVTNHCKTCDIYQWCKQNWSRVNVDLLGPKTVKKLIKLSIHVMTMVDPVTGWFEQAQLYGTMTAHLCKTIFDNTWLVGYLPTREIGFDNVGEFNAEF